jgi:hypothetical protein
MTVKRTTLRPFHHSDIPKMFFPSWLAMEKRIYAANPVVVSGGP